MKSVDKGNYAFVFDEGNYTFLCLCNVSEKAF